MYNTILYTPLSLADRVERLTLLVVEWSLQTKLLTPSQSLSPSASTLSPICFPSSSVICLPFLPFPRFLTIDFPHCPLSHLSPPRCVCKIPLVFFFPFLPPYSHALRHLLPVLLLLFNSEAIYFTSSFSLLLHLLLPSTYISSPFLVVVLLAL